MNFLVRYFGLEPVDARRLERPVSVVASVCGALGIVLAPSLVVLAAFGVEGWWRGWWL